MKPSAYLGTLYFNMSTHDHGNSFPFLGISYFVYTKSTFATMYSRHALVLYAIVLACGVGHVVTSTGSLLCNSALYSTCTLHLDRSFRNCLHVTERSSAQLVGGMQGLILLMGGRLVLFCFVFVFVTGNVFLLSSSFCLKFLFAVEIENLGSLTDADVDVGDV